MITPFTQEEAKEAARQTTGISTDAEANAYFLNKQMTGSGSQQRKACLSLAVNDLYGINKEANVANGISWLKKGADLGSTECSQAIFCLSAAAFEYALHTKVPERPTLNTLKGIGDSELITRAGQVLTGVKHPSVSDLKKNAEAVLEKYRNLWETKKADAGFFPLFKAALYEIELRHLNSRNVFFRLFNFGKRRGLRACMLNAYLEAAKNGSILAGAELIRDMLTHRHWTGDSKVEELLAGYGVINFFSAIRYLLVLFENKNLKEAGVYAASFCLSVFYQAKKETTDEDFYGRVGAFFGKGQKEGRALYEDIRTVLVSMAEKGDPAIQHSTAVFLVDFEKDGTQAEYYLRRACAQNYHTSFSFLFDLMYSKLSDDFKKKEVGESGEEFFLKHQRYLNECIKYGYLAVSTETLLPEILKRHIDSIRNLGGEPNLEWSRRAADEHLRLTDSLFGGHNNIL